MYCEIYLDVLFGVNMFMDFIALYFVGKFSHRKIRVSRILIASVFGAFGGCVIILLFRSNQLMQGILAHGILNPSMLCIGISIKEKKEFFKSLFFLYVAVFLMGGILQWLYVNIFYSSSFILCLFITIMLILVGEKLVQTYQIKESILCSVVLENQSRHVVIQGLVDTGNRLQDPYTRKPVSIVEEQYVKELIEKGANGIRLIPYHSVGKKRGLLPSFTVHKMLIQHKDGDIAIENAVIGVVKDPLSANGEFQMIINNSCFHYKRI